MFYFMSLCECEKITFCFSFGLFVGLSVGRTGEKVMDEFW